MDDFLFQKEIVDPKQMAPVIDFLQKQGIVYDDGCEFTIAYKTGGRLAATGSFEGKVLKCIAAAPEFEGEGLGAAVVSQLIHEEYARGRHHLFLYTKPANQSIFASLGFYGIERAGNKALLMENRADGLQRFLESLKKPPFPHEETACVVANCNPFTKGHQHLMEYAAAHCKFLHLFILGEEKSLFPAEVRLRLAKEGTKHLPNIVVHLAKDYMISAATFPSYFLKDQSEAVQVHAELDVRIFARHIAPYLHITKRFAGEEPFSPTTAVYNQKMEEILPACGIDFEVIPRLAVGDVTVSATTVRSLLLKRDMEKLKELVPGTTYDLLEAEFYTHTQKDASVHSPSLL